MEKITYLYGTGSKIKIRLKELNIYKPLICDSNNGLNLWVGEGDNCVVAINKKRILGIWIFNKMKKNYASSLGTIVKLKRQGIAKKLWSVGIKRYNLKTIEVSTCSDKGETLIRSLQESFPNVFFNKQDKGYRKLRDLRKVKRT